MEKATYGEDLNDYFAFFYSEQRNVADISNFNKTIKKG